jgi:hypothetical protein
MRCRFIHPGLFAIAFAGFCATVAAQAPTVASAGAASPAARQYNTVPFDDAVAQANARVDLAEHNLAAARRSIEPNATNLGPGRRSPGERARVEFYKRDLQVAHTHLTDVLRQHAAQAVPDS